jgi:hypothetical protein
MGGERVPRRLLLASLIMFSVVRPAGEPSARAGSVPCDSIFHQVPSPLTGGATLADVKALSATDVWAVGSQMGFEYALTIHWDGTSWAVIDNPLVGRRTSLLLGVSGVSTSDVWAVGSHDEGQTLALHWNGVRWKRFPTPVEESFSFLWAVSAIASDDVWAVGSAGMPSPVILHWDGTVWSEVPSPPLADGFRDLTSVTAIASDDVWVAGSQSRVGSHTKTLVEHWDGKQWRVIPTPNVPGADNHLSGIDAGSVGDIWAVGEEESNKILPLTEHWDGTQWTIVPADLGGYWGSLSSVVSISPTDVLAVGYKKDTTFYRSYPLAMEWDGTTWQTVTVESQGIEQTSLSGVSEVSPTEAWSVGLYDTERDFIPLIVHRCT